METKTMKGSMRILFLIMLFCIQNIFAQTKPLKPEQVFGMYFDTFVKQDEHAQQKLSAYLIPFLGAENTYSIDVNNSFSDEVQNLTGIFLANLPKEKAAACKTEAEEFFDALLSNLKNTEYKIKSIKDVKIEYADKSFVTELNVDLSFPVPAKTGNLKAEDIQKMTAEDLKQYLKKEAQSFAKSTGKVTVKQIFKLYQIKKEGNVYYWNGSPQELVWKLSENYFKNLNH